MSYFKAKMHQIRFRPRWWSSQRFPESLAGFNESYLYRLVRGGRGRKKGEGDGEERGEREEEGEAALWLLGNGRP